MDPHQARLDKKDAKFTSCTIKCEAAYLKIGGYDPKDWYQRIFWYTTLRCTAELNERPSIPVINILTSAPSNYSWSHIRLGWSWRVSQLTLAVHVISVASCIKHVRMSEPWTEKNMRWCNWLGQWGSTEPGHQGHQGAVIIDSIPRISNVPSGFTAPKENTIYCYVPDSRHPRALSLS